MAFNLLTKTSEAACSTIVEEAGSIVQQEVMWLYESINIYLKSKSDVYFKMKPYRYVITINNTSNSAVLKWQHIFHHPVWVQTKTRTNANHRNCQFRIEGHGENFHGNSWEFGMAFFDKVSVPNPIYVLFVN